MLTPQPQPGFSYILDAKSLICSLLNHQAQQHLCSVLSSVLTTEAVLQQFPKFQGSGFRERGGKPQPHAAAWTCLGVLSNISDLKHSNLSTQVVVHRAAHFSLLASKLKETTLEPLLRTWPHQLLQVNLKWEFPVHVLHSVYILLLPANQHSSNTQAACSFLRAHGGDNCCVSASTLTSTLNRLCGRRFCCPLLISCPKPWKLHTWISVLIKLN